MMQKPSNRRFGKIKPTSCCPYCESLLPSKKRRHIQRAIEKRMWQREFPVV